MAEHRDMRKKYYIVFAVLIAGTILTVAAAVTMEETPVLLNISVALAIALVKATCVAMIFMHLKYDEKVLRIAVFFPLALLIVFILGNVPDTAVAMSKPAHAATILPQPFTPGEGAVAPELAPADDDEDDDEEDDDEDEC